MKFATVAAMRYIEEQANKDGVSDYEMMTEAGNSAALLMAEKYDFNGKRVTMLCGKGNNGGDGFVVASRLHELGALVTVVLCKGDPDTPTAAKAFAALPSDLLVVTLQDELSQSELSADFIVDAIYGIGFSGQPTPTDSHIFRQCAQSRAVKISLDLPSGVEGDSGRFTCCFPSNLTIAIAVAKPAHLVNWSPIYAQELLIAETGLTQAALSSGMLLHALESNMCSLPARMPWSHKGQNGRLGLVCGSAAFSGAAVLACQAALRSGVGYVNLISTDRVCDRVAQILPEVIFTRLPENKAGGISKTSAETMLDALSRCSAVLFGCGLGDTDDTAALLRSLLSESSLPIVLDADGLNALHGEIILLTGKPVVMTPHLGEFSRLASQHILAAGGDYTLAAARISAETGVTVLLKGPVTSIFRGNRQPVFSYMGNDGLAKGGSGDVLAGIIGSLLAQQSSRENAALCGAWIHGRAAEMSAQDLGVRSMLPSDLAEYLPEAFLELEELDCL